MTGVIRTVGVVVPAHDEELLLPGCLHALRTAAEQVRGRHRVDVVVVVVLDRCTDRSAEVVSDHPWVHAVTSMAGAVGRARAIGLAQIIGTLAAV